METRTVKGSIKEAERKAEKAYGKARQKVSSAKAQETEFRGWVQEFPGMALAGALLVGFMTGSFLKSRH